MIIYVDIDNTICHTENSDYHSSKPRQEQIDKIKVRVEYQLTKWDCKYTRIETQKKPSYDLFICDKTKRIEEI